MLANQAFHPAEVYDLVPKPVWEGQNADLSMYSQWLALVNRWISQHFVLPRQVLAPSHRPLRDGRLGWQARDPNLESIRFEYRRNTHSNSCVGHMGIQDGSNIYEGKVHGSTKGYYPVPPLHSLDVYCHPWNTYSSRTRTMCCCWEGSAKRIELCLGVMQFVGCGCGNMVIMDFYIEKNMQFSSLNAMHICSGRIYMASWGFRCLFFPPPAFWEVISVLVANVGSIWKWKRTNQSDRIDRICAVGNLIGRRMFGRCRDWQWVAGVLPLFNAGLIRNIDRDLLRNPIWCQ